MTSRLKKSPPFVIGALQLPAELVHDVVDLQPPLWHLGRGPGQEEDHVPRDPGRQVLGEILVVEDFLGKMLVVEHFLGEILVVKNVMEVVMVAKEVLKAVLFEEETMHKAKNDNFRVSSNTLMTDLCYFPTHL